MIAEDHAILIGIDNYPELGEGGQPANLHGPRYDVDAVKKWLLDPLGGNLPPDGSTIHEVLSPAAGVAAAAAAQPTVDQLDALFARIDGIAQQNKNRGDGRRVGRRLYLYMSGHGFSPGRQRACLYSANAMYNLGLNVHATGWINWWQDAGYFREFVLWVDACMNRMLFLQPHDPPMQPLVVSTPPLANFVAFAAQRPLKAVEQPIAEDAGNPHGVFTWTLLEGLRGAAADANGRVTGISLANWVRNAQSARYSAQDRSDRDVAQEPEIVQQDGTLVFARGVSPPAYSVRLSFPPQALGQDARLWAGSPPTIQQTVQVTNTSVALSLVPGLYLVDVPAAGLRQGFEVLCPTAVVVSEQGPPVRVSPGSAMFKLDVDPVDPTAEIFLIDSRFSLVDSHPARLSTPLPAGLFKIKTRIGNAVSQRVVLLDRDDRAMGQDAAAPQIATVMPILDTAASHEYQDKGRRDALQAASALAVGPGQAVVMLMARVFSDATRPVAGIAPPWHGVRVVDANGETVIDLEVKGTLSPSADAFGYHAVVVSPGFYFLQITLENGQALEQSLVLCAGWRTEVYLLRRVAPGTAVLDPRPRISVMMHKPDQAHSVDSEDRIIEAARVALANERRILTHELEEALMLKFDNPIAGIFGGHLLLVERERDPGRDISMLDVVVRNLRKLVGPSHPDVAALALQCSDSRLRTVTPLSGPPMLQRSWAVLAQAAARRPNLVSADLWQRVQAQSAMAPFLVWNPEEGVKTVVRQHLALAIFGPQPTAAPAHAADLALQPVTGDPGIAGRRRAVARVGRSGEASLSPEVRARAKKLNVPLSAVSLLREAGE